MYSLHSPYNDILQYNNLRRASDLTMVLCPKHVVDYVMIATDDWCSCTEDYFVYKEVK
jgi:hypothetical protein